MINRRKLLRTGVWLAAGVTVASCANPTSSTATAGDQCGTGPMTADLAEFLDDLAGEGKFSGAVLLDHRGCTVLSAAYGVADRQAGIPNTPSTRFTTASLGKFITGVTAARTVQDGRLSFDTTFGQAVPQLRNPALRPLTLHQLLTHTAALPQVHPNPPDNPTGAAMGYLPMLEALQLIGRPGDQWKYSNAGYIAATLMIEQANGRPFEDVVRDHIFTPAQMRDTLVVHPDTPDVPVALRYASAEQPVRRAVTTGAGGYYTSVVDLVAFSRALLGHRLLDERHTDEVISGRNAVPGGKGGLYSYGCSTKALDGHRVVEHNGGSPGANAWLRIYPDDGYTLATLCNVHDPHGGGGVKPIVDKVQQLIAQPG